MNSQQRLADAITRLRSRLTELADRIAGVGHADDVIHDAFAKLSSHLPPYETASDGLIVKTVINLARDFKKSRKSARRALARSADARSAIAPARMDDLTQIVDPHAAFVDLTLGERPVFIMREIERRSHREIAEILGRSHDAVRKAHERATKKVRARGFQIAIRNGQYELLNQPRLTSEQAAEVARLCHNDANAVDSLCEVLRCKELNRAIKNTTLILTNLLPRGRAPANRVEQVMVSTLARGELYRGQLMYVADALIDADYRRHIWRVRTYLLNLDEFQDRPARRTLTAREMADPNPVTIFDVKGVRPIGRQLRTQDIERLRTQYLTGVGSTDFRRALGYELLRVDPTNTETLRGVVLTLHEEEDQTNACYVVKYLRDNGLPRNPHILDSELACAVQHAARRWPGNAYLVKSADVIDEMLWVARS